jgi:AcrR family transcriptional regulator
MPGFCPECANFAAVAFQEAFFFLPPNPYPLMPRTPDQFEELREKSKEKIIYAAVQLFSTVGYFSTSVSNIAEKAGVSKGLIYNYFDSKESVLESIIQKAFEEVDRVFNFGEAAPPKQRLENIINRLFESLRLQSDFMRMYLPVAMQVRRFEFVQAITQARLNRTRKELETLLEALGYADFHREAYSLACQFDGIVLNHAILEDAFPFDEMREYLLDRYIYSVPPAPEA